MRVFRWVWGWVQLRAISNLVNVRLSIIAVNCSPRRPRLEAMLYSGSCSLMPRVNWRHGANRNIHCMKVPEMWSDRRNEGRIITWGIPISCLLGKTASLCVFQYCPHLIFEAKLEWFVQFLCKANVTINWPPTLFLYLQPSPRAH